MNTALNGSRRQGLGSQAYTQLRSLIVEGAYQPGEPLFESRLADQLGMSRTPVREALQVLARDGFLEFVPSRGYSVPRASPSDLRELFEIREGLEGMAARVAAQRAEPDDIAALRQLCDAYDRAENWQQWASIGAEFHARIAAASHNRRIAEALNSLAAQIDLTRRFELRAVSKRHDGAAIEHRAVMEAIAARDPDAAEARAREHVRSSHQASVRRIQGWG